MLTILRIQSASQFFRSFCIDGLGQNLLSYQRNYYYHGFAESNLELGQTTENTLRFNRMGHRGFHGFRYKGKYYMMYHHWSHLTGLGFRLLSELRKMMKDDKFDEWLELFKKLRIVTENDKPTEEDILSCQPYTDDENKGNDNPWSSLLGKCHGSFEKTLRSGYMCTELDDIRHRSLSLWIENVYILDFDAKKLIIHYSKNGEETIEEFDLYHLPRSFEYNGEHTYDEEAPILK